MASPLLLLLSLLLITPFKIYGETDPDTSSSMTHLHFYMHDIVSGSNPTAIQVAKAPSNSSGFGSIRVIDDPLTKGPNLITNAVGQAQGFYATAGLSGTELFLSANILFTGGNYNGSTVSIFGRDSIFDSVRELSVIGGSGKFRMARGYVLLKTVSASARSVILDVDLFVLDSSLSTSIAENVPSNNGTSSNDRDAASSSSNGSGPSKSGVISSGDLLFMSPKFLVILVLLVFKLVCC
ncbi:hypothetical protein LUZ60_004557 [Juncus effusus]|nr:hypothetical protein LUZ60_004557 [Juncus effusus]